MTPNRTAPRTPYEVRLELLQLSFQLLLEQHRAKAVANGQTAADSAPTTDDIVAEADKMNFFVSKGSMS